MTRARILAVALLATLAAACDDGDADPSDETTVVSVSTASAVTTATAAVPTDPTTTATTSAPTTAAPTTPPPPTTSPEDALKAQIAADYVSSVDRYFELVNQPSLDNLAERAKLASADGSEYYAAVVALVEELVQLGDRIVPNDPDIRKVIVEDVELLGAAPYVDAIVAVCAVSNAKQVTPMENLPVGQEIITAGTGVLTAIRSREAVRLVAGSWLPTTATVFAEGIWEGEDTCPPA
ncbi:MAG: hypothetical protein ABW122_14240 [Ilumatobacteraceae bacterium]